MGVILGAIMVGVPGIIFLIYCLTPKGRRWMKANNLLWYPTTHGTWVCDLGDYFKNQTKKRKPNDFRSSIFFFKKIKDLSPLYQSTE